MSDSSVIPTPEPDADDDVYALDRKAVGAILDAVEAGDAATLSELMEPLHAADIADLLEQIDAADRRSLIVLYGKEFDGDILSELDEGIREDVLAALSPQVLSRRRARDGKRRCRGPARRFRATPTRRHP